jgi:hypothetical protein
VPDPGKERGHGGTGFPSAAGQGERRQEVPQKDVAVGRQVEVAEDREDAVGEAEDVAERPQALPGRGRGRTALGCARQPQRLEDLFARQGVVLPAGDEEDGRVVVVEDLAAACERRGGQVLAAQGAGGRGQAESAGRGHAPASQSGDFT